MTNCAKCGAELIGKKKFCAACGAPVVDPRTASSPGGAPLAPGAYGGAPPSRPGAVNPFAETSLPSKKQRDSMYGPPPEVAQAAAAAPAPSPAAPPAAPLPAAAPVPSAQPRAVTVNDPASSNVSPLAVSNVVSQRGAYDHAMAQAPVVSSPVPPQESSAPKPIPGTQLMPSVQTPPLPGGAPAAPAASAPAKKQEKTQLMMGAFPNSIGKPPSAVAPSAQAPSAQPPVSASPHAAPIPTPGPAAAPPPPPTMDYANAPYPAAPAGQPSQPYPQNLAVPSPGAAFPPATYGNPYGAASYGAQPPQPPAQTTPQWGGGWNAPAPPPAAQPYGGFGYAPGTRVVVTWSNGQRYPGTVQQTSGSQCLVVFPDGQQHWVDVQYVAPG
jgi:hypothetical protein